MGAVTITIAPEHPALAGHFPGAPILPGVLLLDEMVCAVEQARPHAGTRWRIGAAKFVKPVRPGEHLAPRARAPAQWLDPLQHLECRTTRRPRRARARDRARRAA